MLLNAFDSSQGLRRVFEWRGDEGLVPNQE